MQQTVWAMDGSFFAQRISGIQRYSIELLAALDAIVPAGLVEIVVPQGVKTPAYTNIKVVPFGTRKGLAWQQLDYPCYLKRRSAKGLSNPVRAAISAMVFSKNREPMPVAPTLPISSLSTSTVTAVFFGVSIAS